MAATFCCRPLKKPRLGPPDVYPQDAKQREDELTEENVKKGFAYQPLFVTSSNEYGSAKDIVSNVPISKFVSSFNNITTEKHKINTYQDGNKKKSTIAKENFWNVTARSRSNIQVWFQDLAGNKPLTVLAKKVPIFNKREEIFSSLCDNGVPMLRATWFIKMTSAYNTVISEAKNKKRSMGDPSIDWTHSLTKYLRDQLSKLSDYYQSHFGGITSSQQRMTPEVEQSQKYWNYTVRLANWLYEESLLDRQEFLQWLLDVFEKGKASDDVLLKYLIPLVLKYVDQIVLSQTLARNLSHVCTKKLSTLYSAAEQMQTELPPPGPQPSIAGKTTTVGIPTTTSSSSSTSTAESSTNTQTSVLSQYKNCPQHNTLVIALAAILQAVTISCPGALIWNSTVLSTNQPNSSTTNDASGNKVNVLGSPLDRLALAPSSLPTPIVNGRTTLTPEVMLALVASEEEIKIRGKSIESRWSPDKYQDKTSDICISALAVQRVLTTLDILDKFNFSKAATQSSVDVLYSKIFPPLKASHKLSQTDQAIAILLCEWAITKYRVGKHRAIVVAKLLQKRQMEMNQEKEEKATQTTSTPVCQKVLYNFLDNYAPVVDNYQHGKGNPSFAQLILLFGELIRHDVFSHNSYMFNLISRGELNPTPPVSVSSPQRHATGVMHPPEMEHTEECVQEGDVAHSSMDVTMPSHDDVLGSNQLELDRELLLHQERLQQLLDQGDSEPFLDHEPHVISSQSLQISLAGDASQSSLTQVSQESLKVLAQGDINPTSDITVEELRPHAPKKSQHVQYATHFPIPFDCASQHDINQRLVLLYGVGKSRNDAIHKCKEITNSLKKMLHDLASPQHGGSFEYSQGLKGSVLETRRAFEEKISTLYSKFSSLPCFEQYMAIAECTSVLQDIRSQTPSAFGLTRPLPSVAQLEFVFDLFEVAGDVQGLIDFIAITLIPDEDTVIPHAIPTLSIDNEPSKAIVTIAMLRHYHACLSLMPGLMARIFKGLLQTVENISDPSMCTSSERCILAYLHDIYASSADLEMRCADIFSTAHTKIKKNICSSVKPSLSNAQYDPKYMSEFFNNPRMLRINAIWEHLLSNKKASDVYSFVCNAMISVCNCQNSERLHDIALLCSEVTAHFGRLSSEWLGVLKALCCSSTNSYGFVDLLLEVEVSDLSIHESVATFTAVMIARGCFSLEDVIYQVAMDSLLDAIRSGVDNQDAESGARLTCHLLLRLLDEKTDFMSHDHSSSRFSFKSSPDHLLLSAAHDSIGVHAVLTILKAMLRLSESGRGSGAVNQVSRDDTFRSLFSSRLDDFPEGTAAPGDIFSAPLSATKPAIESSNLSGFATYTLQVICGQEWVRERCLQDPLVLFSPELLLDPELSVNQLRKLLHLICYPAGVPSCLGSTFPASHDLESVEDVAGRVLQNLDQWSLRKSWLELQLMIKQASKEDMCFLLDSIASAAMNVFVQRHEPSLRETSRSHKSGVIKGPEWLVAPLISRLPSSVQGRLLKAAGEVLGTHKWWKPHSDSSNPVLVHTQPFLSLVLACLKGQEDQREGLLTSIDKQITHLLNAPVEERCPADVKSKEALQEALHLRISLIGAMFDTIQRNVSLSSDWATLLFQLVSSGTVTAESLPSKKELLTNVLDMVSVLISVVTNTESAGSSSDEARKATKATLFKKLKRELAGKRPSDITQCKQLLPLPSLSHNVFTVERETDNKHTNIQPVKINGKQKISAWDLMEGNKNPAPFAWSWFGAVRIERRPSRYEQEFRRLKHHTHIRRKPSSYFTSRQFDDDVEEDDDEKMDAEEGGDKSSLPSTPQTPAEAKGQFKSVGTPGTPGSSTGTVQPTITITQPETKPTADEKLPKPKSRQRNKRQPRQPWQGPPNFTAQQRKMFQNKAGMLYQQQGMMFGQPGNQQYMPQQPGQLGIPGQSGIQGQPMPGQGGIPGQPMPGQPIPGQGGIPGQPMPGQAGIPGQPMPGQGGIPGQPIPAQVMAGQGGMPGQPRMGTADTKSTIRSLLVNRGQAAQAMPQNRTQTTPIYQQLLAQQQQQQQQGQTTQQTLYNLQQQLQRTQQMQPSTQQLRHLPQPQATIQSAQAPQNYTFQQSQRPNSLQIPNRGQVTSMHGSKPSTPTSLGLPTTVMSSASTGYGPQTSGYQVGSSVSHALTRPQMQAQQVQQQQQQQQVQVQQQQQQQQFTLQHAIQNQSQVQQAATQLQHQITQQAGLQQTSQYQQQVVNRVTMQQAQQQQQQQQQVRIQQMLAYQKKQQQQKQQQQQQQQMPQDLMRQLRHIAGGGSQDLFSTTTDEISLQRQLSAPADVGLQRQVSQDITQYQRQLSTPVPQELSQQQQFTTNQQFQPGQF